MIFWTPEKKYTGTPTQLVALTQDSVDPEVVMSPLSSSASSAATLGQLLSLNKRRRDGDAVDKRKGRSSFWGRGFVDKFSS